MDVVILMDGVRPIAPSTKDFLTQVLLRALALVVVVVVAVVVVVVLVLVVLVVLVVRLLLRLRLLRSVSTSTPSLWLRVQPEGTAAPKRWINTV